MLQLKTWASNAKPQRQGHGRAHAHGRRVAHQAMICWKAATVAGSSRQSNNTSPVNRSRITKKAKPTPTSTSTASTSANRPGRGRFGAPGRDRRRAGHRRPTGSERRRCGRTCDSALSKQPGSPGTPQKPDRTRPAGAAGAGRARLVKQQQEQKAGHQPHQTQRGDARPQIQIQGDERL